MLAKQNFINVAKYMLYILYTHTHTQAFLLGLRKNKNKDMERFENKWEHNVK